MKYLLLIFCLASFFANSQSLNENWTYRYNGEGDFSDRFTCSQLDMDGNLVVGGSTSGIGTGRNVLIQKISSSGNVLWTRIYNGPGDGADEAQALAIDNNNNIYVTGFQKGAGSGNDIITLKYSTDGDSLWAAVYNNNSYQYDQGNSITVDNNGNVIVSGQSDNDPTAITNDDYITIKYNPNGNQLWANTYNGPGNALDRPVKVLTDANGNVYVTGTSDNGNDNDYLTVKYSATGTQLWTLATDRGGTDRATAMTIDNAANLYITGRSKNANNYDYYTVKINSSGAQVWFNVFDNVDDDRPIAIALDGNGNVLVTGHSDNSPTAALNYDIRTIKISPTGTTLWSNPVYNGAGNKDDIPVDLRTDAQGNVYVTGYSDVSATGAIEKLFNIVTLKYNSSGSLVWQKIYDDPQQLNDVSYSMTTDINGNIYVVGYNEESIKKRNALVLKYDNTSSLQWSSQFNGIGDNSDNVLAMTADDSGNLYLAGYTVRFEEDRDFFVAKLNAAGDTLWTYVINGTSPGSTDEANAIALDQNGNVIVTGITKNSGTSSDFAIAKFSPDGQLQWYQTYDNGPGESDRAEGLAVDANNNIYVTGRSDNDPSNLTNYDYLTLCFDTDGILKWVNSYDGQGDDRASVVRISNGAVYVTGKSFQGLNYDILTFKLDINTGNILWQNKLDRGGDDTPRRMLVDSQGYAYIAGSSTSANGLDIVTMRLRPDGQMDWAKYYNNPQNGDDIGEGLAIHQDTVYTCGYTATGGLATNSSNVVLLKYLNTGVPVWEKTYDSPNSLEDVADEIAVDNEGYIFVATHSNSQLANNINFDFNTLVYTPGGDLLLSKSYNGTADTSDVPTEILIKGNKVYVGGGSWGSNQQRDLFVICYEADLINAAIIPQQNANEALIFPNPFTNALHVSADQLPGCTLLFSDLNGKELYRQKATAISTDLRIPSVLPSGMYQLSILKSDHSVLFSQLVSKL